MDYSNLVAPVWDNGSVAVYSQRRACVFCQIYRYSSKRTSDEELRATLLG